MGREARGGDRFKCQALGGHRESLEEFWVFGKGTGYRLRQWNDSFALIGLGRRLRTELGVVYRRRERTKKPM